MHELKKKLGCTQGMYTVAYTKSMNILFMCIKSSVSMQCNQPAVTVKGRSLAVIGGKLTVLTRLWGWVEVARVQRMVYVPRNSCPSVDEEAEEEKEEEGEGRGTVRQ